MFTRKEQDLSATVEKDDRRIMFDTAGMLLEKLALDSYKSVENLSITKIEFKEALPSKQQTESSKGSSEEDLSNEESSNEESSTEDDSGLQNNINCEEEETKSMKVDIFYNEIHLDDESSLPIEATSNSELGKGKELENKNSNIDTIYTSNNNEDKVEIDTLNIEEKQDTPISDKSQTNILNEVEETNNYSHDTESIFKMLSMVESRQVELNEKMLALKASTESLKEQLEEERRKLQEDRNKTIELEKLIKNENQLKDQFKNNLWIFNGDDILQKVDTSKDFVMFSDSRVNLQMDVKKQNYQNWLSQLAVECEQQLTKVQNNLSMLKPLKQLANSWNENEVDDKVKEENEKNTLLGNVSRTSFTVTDTHKSEAIKDFVGDDNTVEINSCRGSEKYDEGIEENMEKFADIP